MDPKLLGDLGHGLAMGGGPIPRRTSALTASLQGRIDRLDQAPLVEEKSGMEGRHRSWQRGRT
jgi:hypothetical protein